MGGSKAKFCHCGRISGLFGHRRFSTSYSVVVICRFWKFSTVVASRAVAVNMFSKDDAAIGLVLSGSLGGGRARGHHHLIASFLTLFGDFPPLDLLVQVLRRVNN